jgi:hypothetical protein
MIQHVGHSLYAKQGCSLDCSWRDSESYDVSKPSIAVTRCCDLPNLDIAEHRGDYRFWSEFLSPDSKIGSPFRLLSPSLLRRCANVLCRRRMRMSRGVAIHSLSKLFLNSDRASFMTAERRLITTRIIRISIIGGPKSRIQTKNGNSSQLLVTFLIYSHLPFPPSSLPPPTMHASPQCSASTSSSSRS